MLPRMPVPALCITALVLLVSGCSSGAQGASSEPSSGINSTAAGLLPEGTKKITVAMDATYAPFETVGDGGKVVGIDPDLVQSIGSALGIDVDIKNVGFDSIIPGIQANKYDAAASAMSVTPEREKVVDFVEYAQAGSGLLVKSGNPQGLKMDPLSLCGRSVGAPKGTIQAIEQLPAISKKCEAAGKPKVEVSQFPNQDAVNLAVSSQRVDAAMAASVSLRLQAKGSDGNLELAPGDDYSPKPIGIAFPKKSPLLPAAKAVVSDLAKNGELTKIVTKWGLPETAVKLS